MGVRTLSDDFYVLAAAFSATREERAQAFAVARGSVSVQNVTPYWEVAEMALRHIISNRRADGEQ